MKKPYNEKFLKELADVFLSFNNVRDVEDFLISLLTLDEVNKIPRRLQIIKLLKNNLSQREIAKKLKVSITTVTHGSILLKKGEFKNIHEEVK